MLEQQRRRRKKAGEGSELNGKVTISTYFCLSFVVFVFFGDLKEEDHVASLSLH